MPGKAVKISTVTAESMIPLPGVAGPRPMPQQKKKQAAVEKPKDDQSKSRPQFIYHQIKRTSLSVVLSVLYAKILITSCVAIVVSQEVTHHQLPSVYYEGFFIYLFSTAIFFNFIMLCFFLRDWSCCSGNKEDKKSKTDGEDKKGKECVAGPSVGRKKSTNPATREVYPRKVKDIIKSMELKPDGNGNNVDDDVHNGDDDDDDDVNNEVAEKDWSKESKLEYARRMRVVAVGSTQERLIEPSPDSDDIETGQSRPKKTTQNMHHHGSFYMRLCTIGLGLGSMIYCGLQFRVIGDAELLLSCYQNLQSVNTLLYMAFIFFQMYFIFLHARVNIHCYKIFARFGLMHMLATNICVWIRTGVFECMKKLNIYYEFQKYGLNSTVTNTTSGPFKLFNTLVDQFNQFTAADQQPRKLRESGSSTVSPSTAMIPYSPLFIRTVSRINETAIAAYEWTTRMSFITTTTNSTTANFTVLATVVPDINATTTTTTALLTSPAATMITTVDDGTTAPTPFWNPLSNNNETLLANAVTTLTTLTTESATAIGNLATKPMELFNETAGYLANLASKSVVNVETASVRTSMPVEGRSNEKCDQLNVLKNIVEQAAPYLYPFAIEYSLIGAAVIFIIWRHVGRYQRYVSEENIERKLETMLSQRAAALAHAQNGTKMDCIGSSKGLFFGLLIFVGSVICMILYFVLALHSQLQSMAVYLADLSQTVIMVLSILAILIGFIRAKNLKFYPMDSSELNDLVLAISAVGVFVYSTFGVIAGGSHAMSSQKHLFVVVTGAVAVIQVVLQFLYINDMSKRHVYLPEHDRNKPGRQLVTFLIICNFTMWMLFVFESRKVSANPIQLEFYGFVAWTVLEHITLPLCMFHRLYAAITLAEIWKNSYKQRIE